MSYISLTVSSSLYWHKVDSHRRLHDSFGAKVCFSHHKQPRHDSPEPATSGLVSKPRRIWCGHPWDFPLGFHDYSTDVYKTMVQNLGRALVKKRRSGSVKMRLYPTMTVTYIFYCCADLWDTTQKHDHRHYGHRPHKAASLDRWRHQVCDKRQGECS